MGPLPPADSRELEREYMAHRAVVLRKLRTEYGDLVDHEDLYQEAWTEALELRARGQQIKNLRGLLKTIAQRRARDTVRNRKPDFVEPDSPLLLFEPDVKAQPDEETQIRLDAARLRHVIDALDPRHAAVLKLRWDAHLEPPEIQRRLGVSRKRLEKIVNAAYNRVRAQLELSDGDSEWARHQRSLLLACEAGLATADQRAEAERMVAEDPICRAMLRQMRATLEQLGAAVPLPVIAEEERWRPIGAFRERLVDVLTVGRDQLEGLFGRTLVHGSSLEQASAGAAGLGGGTAAKIVLACLTAAGGTAACIESGLIGGTPPTPKAAHIHAHKKPKVHKATRPVRYVPPPVTPTRAPTKTAPKRRPPPKPPAPKATGPAAPSPAPPGSTEFGPGNVGSSSRPTAPAPAPTDGGGEFTP